jgi:serine-type D-Ala-D-Ala carboxypeptidase/endopeptidase
MAKVSDVDSELLPERVRKAVQDRIAARWYHTLVVGVVRDGKSEVFPFGKLEVGREADGDTVYEIASITKTFTATILAEAVLCTLSGRTRQMFKNPELHHGYER